MPQAKVNIGMVGHIDHGKTTLTEALTGIWTDTHSEELKRGITIKLGYADTIFYFCLACERYSTSKICPYCGKKTVEKRRVSFVDAPGHEMLMATMLSGAAIVDGAVLVIAANEKCPQPQTKEHLMALKIIGVKNVVVAQNKIELVPKEKVIENYQQIRKFLDEMGYSEAPVIPVSAIHKANIDKLIEAIEKYIPTPQRDPTKPPLMFVARSFDVNKPGTPPEKLVGGIVGGSLTQGKLKIGDEIKIAPGIEITKSGKTYWQPLETNVVSLQAMGEPLEEAGPGGLIGVGTDLDPSLTKADALVGSVLGSREHLPEVLDKIEFEVKLLERVVGLSEEMEVKPLTMNEPLMVNIGTATRSGIITHIKGERITVSLKYPVCAERGWRVAISRRVANKWRLIGYGVII
ncbi:MAG: translation initiation factor IF-2 subunit gamma [Candidatus Hadarchaeales archaeon]